MSLLKGNYKLDDVSASGGATSPEQLLEEEYYRTAMTKLGGSIAFIMKGKMFLWTGDDEPTVPAKSAESAEKDKA
jgi:hypothetical protein